MLTRESSDIINQRGDQFGQKVQYFPQFGIGGGAETDLTVHNPGEVPITVSVELFFGQDNSDPGQPRGLVADCELMVEVEPGATETVTLDGESEPCLVETITDGWTKLSAEANFSATLFYRIAGVGNVGVLPSDLAEAMKVFNFFVEGASNTGVALANPDADEESEVSYRVLGEAAGLEREGSLTLEPGGHFAGFFDADPFFASGSGVVELSSTSPVVAVALRLDRVTANPSSLPQGGQQFLLASVPVILPGLPIRGELNEVSPNIIGGHSGNAVGPASEFLPGGDGNGGVEVVGATIGGGGTEETMLFERDGGFLSSCVDDLILTNLVPCLNRVTDNFGTVGGGAHNASGFLATVSGGGRNMAEGHWSTVGGGDLNTASGSTSTVGGGVGNRASADNATVGGGIFNSARDVSATVSGGGGNDASGHLSTVGGGSGNSASGNHATVGGGRENIVGSDATVGGGFGNFVIGDFSTVGGGAFNHTREQFSTVGGGDTNTASEIGATVGGGRENTASGIDATVPGGSLNEAAGRTSFAAGRQAKALFDGSFFWADSHGLDFPAPGVSFPIGTKDLFWARATGGTVFVSGVDRFGNTISGVSLASGGSSWSSISDRNLKENFQDVDPHELLEELSRVPITTWNYKAQGKQVRHMGPMAQDFYAAFGVGENDRHITTVDSDGVALAAIQGLYRMLLDKDAVIEDLRADLASVRETVAELVALQTGTHNP